MAKFVSSVPLSKYRKYHIKGTRQEGILIVSGHTTFPSGNMAQMRDVIACALQGLETWIEEHHGIIGHLKGTLADSETLQMISTTDGEVHSQSGDAEIKQSGNVAVNLVFLVFNIEQKALERKMIEVFDDILRSLPATDKD